MAARILFLNGCNLNMLGVREPRIYGHDTLADIDKRLQARAKALGVEVEMRQSNHEGELVAWIQEARTTRNGIVINPAAYTHTSIAILDALLMCAFPVIELHLSNPHRREEFRHVSFVSKAAKGIICGFGAYGYELALEAMARLVTKEKGTAASVRPRASSIPAAKARRRDRTAPRR
jgi:3-dehydroquinate dehydratase-2